MAKPPSGYPGPEGYPCGKSWNRSIIVDGRIPGRDYGQQFTHTLPPVAAELAGGADKIGWDGAYEKARRNELLDRLEDVVEQLRVAETWLTPREARSIEWLTTQAVAELDAATTIHLQWSVRKKGAYPLSYDDTLEAFPAATHWQDCANPNNILTPPGPHWGFTVDGTGILGKVVCPTRTEMKRRKTDRQEIVNRFVDAAHFIRCAEYGLWRLSLYRKAVRAWEESIAGSGPGGLRLPPKPDVDKRGPGTFTTPVGGPPPPPEPPDLKLPTPPPGPLPPTPTPTGPDAVGTPPRRTHASKKKKGTGAGAYLLGGVAVLGIGYLATKRG